MSDRVRFFQNLLSDFIMDYFSMLKPITKIYGLLYGLQRYEENIFPNEIRFFFGLVWM
jgi:hypothetical protein